MSRGAVSEGEGGRAGQRDPHRAAPPTHTSFLPLHPELPLHPSLTHPLSWDPACPAAQDLRHLPSSWEPHTLPSLLARCPLTSHCQLSHRATALCRLTDVHGVVIGRDVEHRQPALSARLLDEVLLAGPQSRFLLIPGRLHGWHRYFTLERG